MPRPPMPPGHPGLAPRKSGSKAGAVIGILCCVGFLFLFGIAGLVGLTESSDTASPSYAPTYSDTYDADTSDTDTSTAGTSSSDTYTSDTSTPPDTTSPEATAPQPVYALGDHPINIAGNGAVETSCDLPAFALDTASQDSFYQAAAPCLMEMWTPALEAANLPVAMPNVVTFDSGTVTSPCGSRNADETAMYCSSNNTIYMTAAYYRDVEGKSQGGVFLGQFGHEFGHAVQGMTGITNAYWNERYDVGQNTEAGYALSRRSELQATCFEGMALASLQNGGVDNDYIMAALQDTSQRGDDASPVPDHGSMDSNASWVNQGFENNRVTDCNTWLADASYVD